MKLYPPVLATELTWEDERCFCFHKTLLSFKKSGDRFKKHSSYELRAHIRVCPAPKEYQNSSIENLSFSLSLKPHPGMGTCKRKSPEDSPNSCQSSRSWPQVWWKMDENGLNMGCFHWKILGLPSVFHRILRLLCLEDLNQDLNLAFELQKWSEVGLNGHTWRAGIGVTSQVTLGYHRTWTTHGEIQFFNTWVDPPVVQCLNGIISRWDIMDGVDRLSVTIPIVALLY